MLRSKILNDSADDILEHFWKTKAYNKVGWLILTSLDKVLKEKDELLNPHHAAM